MTTQPQPLVVLGASGHAREIMWLVESFNAIEECFDILGFLDDNPGTHGTTLNGHPVLGPISWLETSASKPIAAVFGINSPNAKRAISTRLESLDVDWPNIVHPHVTLSPLVKLGRGITITEGCVLTVNIELHDFVCLNRQVGVGHDAIIGRYSSLNPHVIISGNVTIGPGVIVGTNASVIQGLTVGPGAYVGAGAAVVRDVPPNVVAVGVPAKSIKERTPW